MLKKIRLHGYLAFWLLFVACFAAIGLRGFATSQHSPKAWGNGPYCSSDGLLLEFLGIKDGSYKILDAFQSVPSMRAQMVFWPARDNNTSMSWQVISYLGWPRKVEGMAIAREQLDREIALTLQKPHGAIWLFGFAPPAGLNHWTVIDRGLVFIPVEPVESK